MGLLDTADIKRLLANPDLKADIAKAVAQDPTALDDMAEDVADELSDELEDDAEFKKQIIDAAMASPEFKKKVMKELIDDLG